MIAIKEDDVETIVEECEITKVEAENLLRKNDGDLVKALTAYIRG